MSLPRHAAGQSVRPRQLLASTDKVLSVQPFCGNHGIRGYMSDALNPVDCVGQLNNNLLISAGQSTHRVNSVRVTLTYRRHK